MFTELLARKSARTTRRSHPPRQEIVMSSVLITGASQGIGRATAEELARRGHHVIATARNPRDLDDLPVAQKLRLDVLDQASIDAAFAQAGEVDALISNAGATFRASVESLPADDLERLFALNTTGALRVTQAVLPAMRERRSGRIVYVSSLLGRVAIPMRIGYSATKWALEAIGETLAIETAPFGIRVTLVEPGAVATAGAANAPAAGPEDDPYLPALQALSALRAEPITPEQVAIAIADVIEDPEPPLRVPVGNATRLLLEALHRHPTDRPFTVATA
jgi:NAD(P)-dependent dehydrogenase (short-subunit alcohol dehydrogenase family)